MYRPQQPHFCMSQLSASHRSLCNTQNGLGFTVNPSPKPCTQGILNPSFLGIRQEQLSRLKGALIPARAQRLAAQKVKARFATPHPKGREAPPPEASPAAHAEAASDTFIGDWGPDLHPSPAPNPPAPAPAPAQNADKKSKKWKAKEGKDNWAIVQYKFQVCSLPNSISNM